MSTRPKQCTLIRVIDQIERSGSVPKQWIVEPTIAWSRFRALKQNHRGLHPPCNDPHFGPTLGPIKPLVLTLNFLD
jgi:hypothetical protein